MPETEKAVTMSKAHNPAVFNGGEVDNFYEPNFNLDINHKMRVPKSIRVSGDYSDDDVISNSIGSWNQPIPNEKCDMHVPDRILVVGQNQHMGIKAPPIEMTLEKSVIVPERGMVRVETPPRCLTLGDHYFPTVDDDDDDVENFDTTIDMNTTLPSRSAAPYLNETQITQRAVRDQTPLYSALDVSLAPSEEVVHLRRQVGKLNRRMMAVELENMQRQQREKILYAITLAYFFFKAFNWMTRN